MTYHVTCPISNKVYSYQNLTDMRRFVYAMMVKKGCKGKVWIKDGKTRIGRMWRVGNMVLYKSKGVRVIRTVNLDGTLRKVGRKR